MYLPGQQLNWNTLNGGVAQASSKFRTFPPKTGTVAHGTVTVPIICNLQLPEYSPVLIVPKVEASCGIYGQAHSFNYAQNLPTLNAGKNAIVGILQESASANRVVDAVIFGITRCRAFGNQWSTYGWLPGFDPGAIYSCPGGYLTRMWHSGSVQNDLFFLNPGALSLFRGKRLQEESLTCKGIRFPNVLYAGSKTVPRNQHQLVVTSNVPVGDANDPSDVIMSGFITW